jgi:16S rRNA (cytidine1402-2'-O)-methyltransferase
MNTGTLYIVATPIGNLEDITFRAIRILKEADIIACEDTRTTQKLLAHYAIQKPLISFFQHSKLAKISQILEVLKTGQNVALVTDAGTPGISDPGGKLVAEAVAENIKVVPVPGPSGLAAIASIAGIDMSRFVFMGFPPHKKGRETFFKEIAGAKYPVIYYDSVHRVIKNLELLNKYASDKKIILGRELTKIFEEILKGSIKEITEYFDDNKNKIKGEFVMVVY